MAQNLAKVVTQQNIIKALEEIIAKDIKLIPSLKYDLVYKGKRFPPKDVLRKAAQIQGIENWKDYRLVGGKSSSRFLMEKGFDVQPKNSVIKYFIGGAVWDDGDHSSEFIEEGYWENGYDDRFVNLISSVPVGSLIAIKSVWAKSSTKQSFLRVKCIGEVTDNPKDGKTLIVNWQKPFEYFDIEGLSSYRETFYEVTDVNDIDAIFNHDENEDEENNLTEYTIQSMPLNTILFGPPGTGKTFHTIDKALQIVAPEIYEQNKNNREELTRQFRQLLINDWEKPAGQVAFVTFHQSMTYEDFVEGIKPVMRPEITNDIQYELSDGIFKRLCIEASRTKQFNTTIDGDKKPLTKEMFESLYYTFSQELPDHSENTSQVTLKTKEGYPFDLFRNSVDSIVVKAGEKRVGQNVSFNELWAVINENKTPTYKSYEHIIIDKILEGKSFETSTIENPQKKYVLIIDEINRGNVSQIFGELITLLEDGKRQGQTEELIVTLPYSKKAFSVPSNLYIIGTMNTADRSVEALDTALRRRFSFEEVIPEPNLLNNYKRIKDLWIKYKHTYQDDPEWLNAENDFIKLHGLIFIDKNEYENLKPWENDLEQELMALDPNKFEKAVRFENGIELNSLLEKVNKRLEKLLSKDHKIGHAFFIDVFSVEDLYDAFYQKLIPQLQEYFYGDFGKIGLVLGKDFVKSSEQNEKIGFAPFDYEDAESLLEKTIYRIEDFVQAGITNYDNFLSSVKNIYK